MAENDKDDKGREEIEAAEEKVLFPDTHRKEIVFCGKPVSLRPLPLNWARQLNRAFDKARKYLSENAKDDDCADEEAANAYALAAAALAEFYRLGLDRAAIENAATLPEIMDFCDAQAQLQRENDFLLWRLRGYTEARGVTWEAWRAQMIAAQRTIQGLIVQQQRLLDATETFQSSPSSPASLKSGEDSTPLSPDTPADKSD